jgi:hypothetical protein
MQISFAKGLMAGAVGTAALLAITAASGTAPSSRGAGGHVAFRVNSAPMVASRDAGLGGSTLRGLIQGSGRLLTAQIELRAGASKTLLKLGAYGSFVARCVSAPLAELDFKAGTRAVRLWIEDLAGTSSQVSEQRIAPGSSLGIQSASAEQLNYTIQSAVSHRLSTHVATVQAVQMASSATCDFALTAFAAP